MEKTRCNQEATKGVLTKVMEVIVKTEKTNTMTNKLRKTKTDKDRQIQE